MAGKLIFVLGLGTGYVLGTRAGRARYERMKARAVRVMEQPFVRSRVDAVSTRIVNAVHSQGETITDKVADAVKERLFSSRPAQPAAPEPVSVPATIRPTS